MSEHLAEPPGGLAAKGSGEDEEGAPFAEFQLPLKGSGLLGKIAGHHMGFTVGQVSADLLGVKRYRLAHSESAAWEVSNKAVAGVKMGVAGQLLHIEPAADAVVAATLHQRGTGLVNISPNIGGKSGERRGLLFPSEGTLPPWFEDTPINVHTTDKGAGGNLCGLSSGEQKQHLLAFPIKSDHMHLPHTPQLPDGQLDVYHRRGLHQQMPAVFAQQLEMPQEVGCAVLESRHLAPLAVAAGGVDKDKVVKGEIGELEAIATTAGDIPRPQDREIIFGDGAEVGIHLVIIGMPSLTGHKARHY